jgi:hypothetical protein
MPTSDRFVAIEGDDRSITSAFDGISFPHIKANVTAIFYLEFPSLN